MAIYEGKPNPSTGSIAIVVAKFNHSITERLLDGAVCRLKRAGMQDDQIDIFRVPGSFELPTIVSMLAETNIYDAIIALGAVIHGETTHDLHINSSISKAFCEQGMDYNMPVLFGVLTCNTVEQAEARATPVNILLQQQSQARDGATFQAPDKAAAAHLGNKGWDCAEAALEMIDLMNQIADLND